KALRPGEAVELLEERDLRAEVLDDSLDDDVGLGEGIVAGGRGDAPERGLLLVRGHLSLVDAALQVRGNRVHGAVEDLVADVDQRDGKAGRGRSVGDAVAHRPGADDHDFFHAAAESTRICVKIGDPRMASKCFMCGAAISEGILCEKCDKPRRTKPKTESGKTPLPPLAAAQTDPT